MIGSHSEIAVKFTKENFLKGFVQLFEMKKDKMKKDKYPYKGSIYRIPVYRKRKNISEIILNFLILNDNDILEY